MKGLALLRGMDPHSAALQVSRPKGTSLCLVKSRSGGFQFYFMPKSKPHHPRPSRQVLVEQPLLSRRRHLMERYVRFVGRR